MRIIHPLAAIQFARLPNVGEQGSGIEPHIWLIPQRLPFSIDFWNGHGGK
jgi:hypothetical protein